MGTLGKSWGPDGSRSARGLAPRKGPVDGGKQVRGSAGKEREMTDRCHERGSMAHA